ncbi:ATP-binding protein, partial [Candidatus Woesearchaeota archaeon]|nr:ATP-binding protein [Candidatus Woesearchaeota archaeon]
MVFDFKTTADIKVSEKIVDQVVGQEEAVEVIKKAANQRRHVLLIGDPGTGKSMLGLALAEMLPKEKLVDVIAFPNPHDENQPIVRTAPAGKGRELMVKARMRSMDMFKYQNWILVALVILAMFAPWWARSYYNSDVIFAAFFIGGMVFLASFMFFININKRMGGLRLDSPKVIVDNFGKKTVPFWDATGAHAGALLGDVLHDPLQTFVDDKIVIFDGEKKKWRRFHWTLDECAGKVFNAEKDSKRYKAVFVHDKNWKTLGEVNGCVSPTKILSFNTYDYEGDMVKITTSDSKEITVTPEHKVAVQKHGKIEYVEAQHLKEGDCVFSLQEDTIIDEQDIINTYDARNQAQCALYYQYLDLKEKNPSFGYKRIAKMMGCEEGKTRWCHAKKHIHVPVQTCNWL